MRPIITHLESFDPFEFKFTYQLPLGTRPVLVRLPNYKFKFHSSECISDFKQFVEKYNIDALTEGNVATYSLKLQPKSPSDTMESVKEYLLNNLERIQKEYDVYIQEQLYPKLAAEAEIKMMQEFRDRLS